MNMPIKEASMGWFSSDDGDDNKDKEDDKPILTNGETCSHAGCNFISNMALVMVEHEANCDK